LIDQNLFLVVSIAIYVCSLGTFTLGKWPSRYGSFVAVMLGLLLMADLSQGEMAIGTITLDPFEGAMIVLADLLLPTMLLFRALRK